MRPRRQVFRQEGEYWTVAFEGTVVRLRDVKGLHYLAALLRRPGESLHVSVVLAAAGRRPGALRNPTGGQPKRRARSRHQAASVPSDDTERARLTVTKGIKSAIDRIAKSHAVLAQHLAATIKRGYFCSYTPDPRLPIVWAD